MKLTTTLFALALTYSAIAQDTLPNGSFEYWTGHGSYESANGWMGTSDVTGGFVNAVTKSTDAVDGTYSCKLENKEVLPGTVAPGVITTGLVLLDAQFNPTFHGGAPFTDKPDEFYGRHKYIPGANDTGMIQITFTVWDATAQASIPVGAGYMDIIDSTGWAEVVIPITYFDPRDPDTVLVTIASSRIGSGAPATTQLWVDSLGFRDSIIGGIEICQCVSIQTYPNPATEFLQVNVYADLIEADAIRIYDMTGALIESAKLNQGAAQVDVSTYGSGLYIYTISDKSDNRIASDKFVIQR